MRQPGRMARLWGLLTPAPPPRNPRQPFRTRENNLRWMAARILIEIELNHFNEELRRRLAMYPGHDKLQDLRRPMVADDANETAVAQVNPPALPNGHGLAVAVTQNPTVQRMVPQA